MHQASGDVFVVDELNHRIQRFSSAGVFERAWGWNVVVDGGTGDTDPDAFEVCSVASECQAGSAGTAADGPAGELDRPQGVAVNESAGEVLVRDRGNRRVQVFTLDGAFVRMWGADVDTGGATGFEVCSTAASCKQGVSGSAAGQFASDSGDSTGIAVRQATGDVFVADPGNRRVQQFDADGDFVRAWGWAVDTGTAQFEICTAASTCAAGVPPPFFGAPANGQFFNGNPRHLAVDSAGIVYADNVALVGGASIYRFDSTVAGDSDGPGSAAASMLRPALSIPNPGPAGVTALGVELDGDGAGADVDFLHVAFDGRDVVEYDVSGPTPALTAASPHIAGSGLRPNGLASHTATGDLWLSSTSQSAHRVYVADDDGASSTLDASLQPPANVTADSATLAGSVNPQGFPTSYRFQYSTNGVSWTNVTADQSIGSGVDPVAVDDEVTGLEANRTYRVRMLVTRGFGNDPVPSSEVALVTDTIAPTAVTLPDRGASATQTTLAGSVNPNNLPTTYHFEYGRTTHYGTRVPVPDASAGTGAQPQVVTQTITGLTPEATYHYRLVATNQEGTTTGADRTFTTRPTPAAAAGRGYELVSPPYKIAGLGVGVNYIGPGSAGPSGFAAYDGERFAVQTTWGSTLLDNAFAFAGDVAFAERGGEAGWVSHSPVTRGGHGEQLYRFLLAGTANDDLSLVTWATNAGRLKLFPEQEDPQYAAAGGTAVSDWAGNWELFSPIEADQAGPGGRFGAFAVLDVAGAAPVVVGSTQARGLAGPGDPTRLAFGDRVDGASVYVNDLSGGVSDTFPGEGVKSLVDVCTGQGPQRTEIPVVLAGGALGAQPCPAPLAGRDARLISERGASLGTHPSFPSPVSSKNVVSRDGSRVFFMSPDPAVDGIEGPCGTVGDNCPPQIYVRQRNPDGSVVTRWVSRPRVEGQAATLLGEARFEGASEDGSRVFFKTTSPLTADDPNGLGVAPPPGGVVAGSASSNSWDLYMYELPEPGADPGAGTLTRVSGGPVGGGAGDCNSPGADAGHKESGPTALRFASSDGSRIYFACAGPLADVAGSSDPDRAPDRAGPAGDPTSLDPADANLYLYDANQADPGQRWRFVAQLPRSKSGVVASCASAGAIVGGTLGSFTGAHGTVGLTGGLLNCVRGSSDGGFVTFWTDGRLTVDDDSDGGSGDMYGYDAVSDELVRISAPQGGAGDSYTCLTAGAEVGKQCFGDPGYDAGVAKFSLGVVTDPADPSDRVAFFQSASRLVAEDTDDGYDVYQWRNGDLSLVSTGASDTDGAFYKGNDRTGRNVYFATQDRLSWQDHDAVLDIYTARVGGGIPEPVDPPVCATLAGACQGGGAAAVAVPPRRTSSSSGDGDADAGRRAVVSASVSRRARRRASRTGNLLLAVRTSRPGRVTAVARARLGSRARRVARKSIRMRRAGKAAVRLRLSRPARRRLQNGRALRLSVRVSSPGARSRSIAVRLAGVKS